MKKPCCEMMSQAMCNGTDNEMHGSAVWDLDGKLQIGCIGPLRFCPWCGFDYIETNEQMNSPAKLRIFIRGIANDLWCAEDQWGDDYLWKKWDLSKHLTEELKLELHGE